VPEQLVINDSSTVSKYLILYQTGDVNLEAVSLRANNNLYDYYTGYSDVRFMKNNLFTTDGKLAIGYDCLVRSNKGEEFACVSAHYELGMKYPFRASIYELKSDAYSFPIDFYYKDVLLKQCTVTVDPQKTAVQ
jgi:hypothetical protein